MSDHIKLTALVEKELSNGFFRLIYKQNEITGYLSGKMRQSKFKVKPGDNAIVEVSQYDTKKGRIVGVER